MPSEEFVRARLAESLQSGDVLALSGDLGGGKTTFVKGLAQALGIAEPVTSPTFLLQRILSIPPRAGSKNKFPWGQEFHHFDVYRLRNEQELLDLGWEELIASQQGIIVLEWADKVKKIMPARTIWIKFEFTGQNSRKIEIDHPRQKVAAVV